MICLGVHTPEICKSRPGNNSAIGSAQPEVIIWQPSWSAESTIGRGGGLPGWHNPGPLGEFHASCPRTIVKDHLKMTSWENASLVEKKATTLPEAPAPEMPSIEKILPTAPQAAACVLSTLTTAVCSQQATTLGKLEQEVKRLHQDLQGFQQKVTETLQRLESSVNHLAEKITFLESSNGSMEQRLWEEEDRGIARSKVLTFLLLQEKKLRERCLVMETTLFQKMGIVKSSGAKLQRCPMLGYSLGPPKWLNKEERA